MSHSRVAALLEKRLGEWADVRGIPVSWENVPMTPPSDGLYLQAYPLPASTTAIDLGETLYVLPGVWQVNVIVPAGEGSARARQLADEIAGLFPLGLMLAEGEFSCYISTPPTVYQGITSDTRYAVPVSMNYRAHLITH